MHVYTNIAWWGREGEDACLEHGYWIIHVILYTYILIMNVMMISRACVPTSFVQDCSYDQQIIVIGYEIETELEVYRESVYTHHDNIYIYKEIR